jgi:hypothetical protein
MEESPAPIEELQAHGRNPPVQEQQLHQRWRSLLGGTKWIEWRALRNATNRPLGGVSGGTKTTGVHGGVSGTTFATLSTSSVATAMDRTEESPATTRST